MKQLLEIIEARLARKLGKAEAAFVREKTSQKTENCRHSGRVLTGQLRVCKLKCQGSDEVSALQCWNEKASGCALFKLVAGPDHIREKFRSFSREEISIRWPSIGELYWIIDQIKLLMEKDKGE